MILLWCNVEIKDKNKINQLDGHGKIKIALDLK